MHLIICTPPCIPVHVEIKRKVHIEHFSNSRTEQNQYLHYR